MGKVYKDDVGTEIILDCKEDITDALSYLIKVKKPNGDLVEWEAELKPATTTKMRYFIQEGDLDQSGRYFLQACPELASWKGRGETGIWMIYDHFR